MSDQINDRRTSERGTDNGASAFHDTVITQLAELKTGQNEIAKKLDRMNGSISNLYERDAEHTKALLEHAIECPQIEVIQKQGSKIDVLDRELSLGTHPGSMEMRKRIETLEKIAERCEAAQAAANSAEAIAESKKNKIMDNIVYPLVKTLGIGALILFLLHANEILGKLQP